MLSVSDWSQSGHANPIAPIGTVLTCQLEELKITNGYFYGAAGGVGVGTTTPGAIGISSTPVTWVT